jgi:hypothetical protein
MTRLFDAGEKARKASDDRRSREEVRRRAEEVDRLLTETQLNDAAADKMAQRLQAASTTVQSVVYASYREPGSKWTIEHARAGDDYIYQLVPLRSLKVEWGEVIAAMIATMDSIFPRSLKIVYRPPREDYQIQFFTVTVEKVVGQPGWERACKERALHGLAQINAWPAPAPA